MWRGPGLPSQLNVLVGAKAEMYRRKERSWVKCRQDVEDIVFREIGPGHDWAAFWKELCASLGVYPAKAAMVPAAQAPPLPAAPKPAPEPPVLQTAAPGSAEMWELNLSPPPRPPPGRATMQAVYVAFAADREEARRGLVESQSTRSAAKAEGGVSSARAAAGSPTARTAASGGCASGRPSGHVQACHACASRQVRRHCCQVQESSAVPCCRGAGPGT